jgi:hypothetical protein
MIVQTTGLTASEFALIKNYFLHVVNIDKKIVDILWIVPNVRNLVIQNNILSNFAEQSNTQVATTAGHLGFGIIASLYPLGICFFFYCTSALFQAMACPTFFRGFS